MNNKTKKVIAAVLSLALTGAVLTGCAAGRQVGQEPWQDLSADLSQAAGPDSVDEKGEDIIEGADAYEDNFAVDSKAAETFAQKVKDAVSAKDLDALAELMAFPVYVDLADVNVVETREDFLNLGAETVFTDALLKSVETAAIDNLQPSMAGFSISDGGTANIIFGVSGGALAVSGINY